jgi:hypothetical protein
MGVDCYALSKETAYPCYTMSWWGWRPIVWYLQDALGEERFEPWHDEGPVTEQDAIEVGNFLQGKLAAGELEDRNIIIVDEFEDDPPDPPRLVVFVSWLMRRPLKTEPPRKVRCEFEYRFRVAYVRDFALFWQKSGGFKIA